MSVAQMQAKYVYGVVESGCELPAGAGIGGAELELIAGEGIAALVSDLDSEGLRLGREEMTTHARVLEQVLESGTVLPMRFGVVMAGGTEVRSDLLLAHAAELREQLEQLAGKVELRLRGTYEEEQLMRDVLESEPELRRVRDSLRGRPDDATYYERIELGERIAAAVGQRRAADAEAILAALRPLALAEQVSEPHHERIAINASFLVERERMAEFDQAVDQIGGINDGRIRFKYTGPLPPHSFVELQTEA